MSRVDQAVLDLQRAQLLHRQALTQKQLAAQSGIGQAEISKTERGRESPRLDTYARLVTALDLDDDIVLGRRLAAR